LFGYEEGAIYESKHDDSAAIREYTAVALANGESPALERLLALTRRPQLRDQIDQYTQKLLAATGYTTQYVNLRIRILEAQNRRTEIGAFLNEAVDHADSLERLSELEILAQQQSLEEVRRHALEKQADIATDPVTRLQLRFALVQLLENTDPAEARRQIEKIYRSNNKILGVVRAMVDFYWRAKLYPESIAVLEQAAKDSYPGLSRRFTFEAATKCIEAQRYQQARDLLAPLVKESPYDAQYLAIIADSYAREGDQQSLKKFYLEEIAAFHNAPLSSDDRKSRIAAMRRALIPALTTLKDYSGAIDQYIEVINVFPEDETLVSEAANYALRYNQRAKLLDFYVHTTQQSPRDYRWPVVVARIETAFEDYPAAIDAYGKAIAIRPDRTDLRIARATLNERLLQFDAAIADYEKLYQLTYKDPQWMIDAAEDRARQGRNSDAVTALQTAIVDPAPDRPENYFDVAGRLEVWGILDTARSYAEKGVSAAGPDFLASPQYHDDARIYARIMTRLRQQQSAWSTLQQARVAAGAQLPVVKEQIARQGIAAISNQQWRDNALAVRRANADSGMQAAANEIGTTIALYFTPEEKVSFAEFARTIQGTSSPADVEQILIPLFHNAGLAEEEANNRAALLLNARLDHSTRARQMAPLIELQTKRLQFAALAKQLEDYVAAGPGTDHIAALLAAADAYRSQGDAANELRILANVTPTHITGEARAHYFRLLLDKQPQRLLKLSGMWTEVGQSAADFAVANADSAFAQQVVAARSAQRPPVWKNAYASLVGLYFAEKAPTVNASFLSALGDQTIAERIGKPVDRKKQLAGDIWFYYGSRYGEYLADLAQPNSGDFLPSSLEQSPATASNYLSLADFYFEKGDTAAAIIDYKHFLELSPANAAVHDRLAVAYYKQGQRDAALDEWKLFFSKLLSEENTGRVPETFWSDFGRACDHLADRHLFPEVKTQAGEVVRAYLKHNGNFRSNAVLQSVYVADKDPVDATNCVLDLSGAASDPIAVLADIVDAKWIPLPNRAPIYRHILDAKQNALANLQGEQHAAAVGDIHGWQVRWVRYLIGAKQFTEAGAFLSRRVAVDPTDPTAADWLLLELRVDAVLGTLETKLAAYRTDPDSAPAPELLRSAATEIAAAGDNASAQKILEFVYSRELERRQLLSANFLGLAEIRLNSGDAGGAVQLLRRMILVAGNPYSDLDSAAALLEKTGHNAEAIPILESLANSTPWQPAFRIRLAKAQLATGAKASAQAALTKAAGTQSAPYQQRVQAASLLSGANHSAELGSAELNLLAADPNQLTPAAANQPFFYEARLRAAQNSSDAAQKLHLLFDAVSDTPARDQARMPLFYAAASLHQDEFALAAVANIQRQLLAESSRRVRAADEDEPTDVADSQASENSSPVSAGGPPQLTAQRRAQFVFAVAQAMIHIDRLTDAQPYLQSALHFETNAGRRKEITATLADVRARLRRNEDNLARQPILHAELEQDRVVRPRLVARSTARKTATADPGGTP
jgi:cellulose synthase operon protein C